MCVLLVNDTGGERNFGCVATSSGIRMLLDGHPIEAISSSAIYQLNRRMSRAIGMRLRRLSEVFFDRWAAAAALSVVQGDRGIMASIDGADIVVINGEGSIHDGRPSSWSILAIAKAAAQLRKPVHVVNATVSRLGAADLRVLRGVDRIVVREPASSRYLRAHRVPHELGADAAWIFLRRVAPTLRNAGPFAGTDDRTLVTGGAVRTSSALRGALQGMTGEIWYLRVDSADDRHLREMQNLRLSGVIDAAAVCAGRPERLLPRLREFGRLVSGRHHLNIFGYYLGLPVTVLSGNTHKNEGTQEGLQDAGESIFHLAGRNGVDRVDG